MSHETKLGLRIVVVALMLGILANLLLRATPWGVNVLLWTVSLTVAIVVLARWHRVAAIGSERWFVLILLLFGVLFIWRDSLTLKALDVLALCFVAVMMVMRAQSVQLHLANIWEYIRATTITGVSALIGIISVLFQDIKWSEVRGERELQRAKAVARGIAIAVPLLVLFGKLFASADLVFAGIIDDIFEAIFENLLTHIILTACFAWGVGGFLRILLLQKPLPFKIPLAVKQLSLGIVEIGIVLGLVNALFLSFIVVQVSYLFGGESAIRASVELTYSGYARRGFFELATVSALVLPLLLIMDALLNAENPRHFNIFGGLAVVQIGMLFVIMWSAVKRMLLYQAQYGLTELRLYTTVFMGWLALVFVWFIITVLRQRRERFAFGMVASALLAIILLHGLNPDGFIARVNLARAKTGYELDTYHTTSLSGDAVPNIIEMLPSLNSESQRDLSQHLLKRWSVERQSDWRTWRWGNWNARRLVRKNQAFLEQAAGANE